MDTKTAPPKTTVVEQQPTTWIARVNLGREMRTNGEQIIAKALRERLDNVGELCWLLECKNEWGWSRTTAYRHLNPELLQKDRDRAATVRSDSRNIDPEPRPLDEIAADLRGMGLKKVSAPVTESITCSVCGEVYPKGGLNKHIDKGCGPKDEPDPETVESNKRFVENQKAQWKKEAKERQAKEERNTAEWEAERPTRERHLTIARDLVASGYTARLEALGKNGTDDAIQELIEIRDRLQSMVEATWRP